MDHIQMNSSMKGNKWVVVSSAEGKRITESYKLSISLPPHSPELKDDLELYLRFIEQPSEVIPEVGIYVHFTSKGKNAFTLGGYPARLKDGKMVIEIRGGNSIILNPIEISFEMSRSDGSIDEVAVYLLEKDSLKTICDGEVTGVILTGWFSWSHNIVSEKFIFLLRAFWNGTFDEDDYSSYLQQSSAAPKHNGSGGCYVATMVYGSYDCPEVWTLRRFRDYTLDESIFGRIFIRVYYATSPTLVRWFGHMPAFKSFLRRVLDKFVESLLKKGYENTPYIDKY